MFTRVDLRMKKLENIRIEVSVKIGFRVERFFCEILFFQFYPATVPPSQDCFCSAPVSWV